MRTVTLKADQEVIDIIKRSEIDEQGLTLKGQLDRKQYESVNKFLELAGAKWNRSAKRHLFQPGAKAKIEALFQSGKIVDEKKSFQAFFTPQSVAEDLVAIADIGDGMECLEPSAGEGAIALAARRAGAKAYCIEINPEACKILTEHGFEVLAGDFLQVKPDNASQWPRILMNPPFTNDQDIKHVLHAYQFLLPGGKLYAIMSPGFTFASQRKIRKEFNEFVKRHGRIVRHLPSGTFSESGTDVTTVIVELRREEPESEGA